MKRLILSLSLLATPALAQEPVCALNGAAPVPVAEQAKTEFLAGDYKGFYDIAASLATEREGRMQEVMGPLQNLFPDGFDSCSVVLQRRDRGGMVQEVSLFKVPKPGTGYISLLLTVVPLEEKQRIVFFSYNDQIAQVLEEIR